MRTGALKRQEREEDLVSSAFDSGSCGDSNSNSNSNENGGDDPRREELSNKPKEGGRSFEGRVPGERIRMERKEGTNQA